MNPLIAQYNSLRYIKNKFKLTSTERHPSMFTREWNLPEACF